MKKSFLLLCIFSTLFLSCEKEQSKNEEQLLLGADLSYVNEVEDCGATFRDNGKIRDPYGIFEDRGANIVRLRLWHSPTWTSYSTLPDVKKSIDRAHKEGMKVLLDFHYSDNWADPAHQIIPAAWKNITDTKILGDSLYYYTIAVLNELYKESLTPEFVQVGNEINSEILMQKPTAENPKTNWQRNAALLNRGLDAVTDFNKNRGMKIQTMLHVAQPDEALEWFGNASKNDLRNFDWIGLSYYPNWSKHNLDELGKVISQLKSSYNKEVMIVEVGYPYTFRNIDKADNVLGDNAGLDGYPVSPIGQLSFMIDLTSHVAQAGGKGVIYWEAAWVSSSCKTQWGTGSHWENATFFDATQNNEALPVFDFFKHKYNSLNTIAQSSN
ncbi:arabinogalactan endo-1,4-beta-galactosidase [Spirosomataceae bacterium TFI 002]|nr:arabinogalactan endo-1,4-beta-galactosidase [Spirosomataceae bacterium TFI 002]